MRGLTKRCTLLPVVLTGLLALFGTSCVSKKASKWQEQAQTYRQEVADHEMQTLTVQGIRSDTATLTLPEQSLHNLPQGAGLARKSGRATLTVIRKDSTIIITATCDSLQRLVEYYRHKVSRLNEQVAQTKTKEEKTSSPGLWGLLMPPLLGLLTGLGVGIVIKLFIFK